jgi:DNA-directed RNA polymerase
VKWLAIHVANCYARDGLDKAPIEERIAWVYAHEREILDSADRPLDGTRFWSDAESPWQFLAACYEWAGYRAHGESYESRLPVSLDGSCSGLQHYSALLRDPVGGSAVNLVPAQPGERASDVYSRVAKRTQALSNASASGETARMAAVWRGKVTRAIAKQPTMTMCYGVTQVGVRDQVLDRLSKLDEEARVDLTKPAEGAYLGVEDNFEAAQYITPLLWKAMRTEVLAAAGAMDFLRAIASATNRASTPLRWVAPSGFLVDQANYRASGQYVKVHYKGQIIQVVVEVDSTEMDKRSQVSSIAPNFVHALDASHLMATVNMGRENGIQAWAVVHDSFGTHAGNVESLNVILREAFVMQYQTDWLQRVRDELVPAALATGVHDFDLPEVPAKGTLDIEQVRHSQFFFA